MNETLGQGKLVDYKPKQVTDSSPVCQDGDEVWLYSDYTRTEAGVKSKLQGAGVKQGSFIYIAYSSNRAIQSALHET